MNRTHGITLCTLILVFALSTACLTLFPRSSDPAPTAQWDDLERGPLKFTPPSLPDARVGVLYEVQIEVTENATPVGEFMFEPETLPPGLELSMNKDDHDIATITGIPEKAGTYTFSIHVWCYGTMVNGQMGSQEYTIVVE